MLHGFLSADQQFVVVEGFDQIVEGSGLHGRHRLIHLAKGGDHDHRQIGVGGFNVLQQPQAIHDGHSHVGDDQIQIALFDDFQGFFAIAGGVGLIALVAQ